MFNVHIDRLPGHSPLWSHLHPLRLPASPHPRTTHPHTPEAYNEPTVASEPRLLTTWLPNLNLKCIQK